jgi:hypothetical protein
MIIPNKIPDQVVDISFEDYKHKMSLFDNSTDKLYRKTLKQYFARSVYDTTNRFKIPLFASHNALSQFPKDFKKDNKKLTNDHCLRPSSHFFQMIIEPEYRKKYLDKKLYRKILNIMCICCRMLKTENRILSSFNPRSILKCTTKELYEKAKIKVYDYTKDKVEPNYFTPAFDLLPIEVQDDITDYENKLISLNV